MSTEAPSFDSARQELFYQLNAYQFVRVVGPCRIPENARQNDAITFFHGTAVTLPPPVAASDGGHHGRNKVWFKKLSPQLASKTARFGPLVVHTHPDVIPDAGDLLMGKLVPNDRASDGRDSKDRLQVFYTHVQHLHRLLHLVVSGTSASEQALAHELRVRRPVNKGVDDAWALARLILFGNVQVFADQHRGVLPERQRMKLSSDALTFVYDTATHLEDMSVWDAFVRLVPDAQPPAPRTPAPPPLPIVRPLQLSHYGHYGNSSHSPPRNDGFVGKRRKREVYPQHMYDDEAVSPPLPPLSPLPPFPPLPRSPLPPLPPSPPPPLSPRSPRSPPPPRSPPYFPRSPSPPPPLSPFFQPVSPPPAQPVYDEYDPYNPGYDALLQPHVQPPVQTQTQYTVETVMSLLQAVNQLQSRSQDAAHQ